MKQKSVVILMINVFWFFVTNAQPCNTYDTLSVTACDHYTAPSGILLTSTGVYSDTISNIAGCDSITSIDLELYDSYSTTYTIFTCGEPYTFDDGTVYSSTGLYQKSYVTTNGCDSIIFIDLEVADADGHSWQTASACDQFVSDEGVVYSSTGFYVEFFTGQNGCDSLSHYTVSIETIDSTASWVSAMTIEANEVGADYQWVDCNLDNAIISGANSKTYVAAVNGDYACIVSKGECEKMTNCVRVESLGLMEQNAIFEIYPNPSNGVFLIQLSVVEPETEIKVTNFAGQVLYQATLIDLTSSIDLRNFEVGTYFLSLSNTRTTAQRAFVIH